MRALVDSAKASKDFLMDSTKAALNVATGSRLFEAIPFVSAVTGIIGVCDALMAFRLRRNIQTFLRECADATPEKLEDLYEKVVGDPRYRDDVPDTIMQVLLDSHKPLKAQIVGSLFAALAEKRLTEEEFNELALIVLNASIPALLSLPAFFKEVSGYSYSNSQKILSSEPLLNSLGVASRHGNMFRISNLGEQLYEHGFRGRIHRSKKHEIYTEENAKR